MGRPVRSGILSRRLGDAWRKVRPEPAPPTVPAHVVAALGGDPNVPARRIEPPAAIENTNAPTDHTITKSYPPEPPPIDDQVRELAAAGLGRRKIAAQLGITEHRVRKALG